jgi:CubicO group peptidase (beta-lactamase class C family)
MSTSAPQLVADLGEDEARYGVTYAALIVQSEGVLAERYGGALPHFDRDPEPVTPQTPLLSWSIAKSVLHAAVGVLVDEGTLDIEVPAAVPEWSAPDDPRRAITLDHLLCMRDGLDFLEDYVDDKRSDVIEMLFGRGQSDVAHYAAERPAKHPPGEVFNYSSGTSNIVARIVGDVVGRGEAVQQFLRDRIFEPLGMQSASAKVDDAGNFIGSSYVYATARDWVKFGQCYLYGGELKGTRVVPEYWVEHGRKERSIDPTDGRPYGAHWWILDGAAQPAFYASGYEGQRIVVCPDLDLVIARFGKCTSEQYDALADWCRQVIAACTLQP